MQAHKGAPRLLLAFRAIEVTASTVAANDMLAFPKTQDINQEQLSFFQYLMNHPHSKSQNEVEDLQVNNEMACLTVKRSSRCLLRGDRAGKSSQQFQSPAHVNGTNRRGTLTG
jgi:hypothetical protein